MVVSPVTAAELNDCTIQGSEASEVLEGTEAADVICGGGGDDTIYGLEGNDELRGGDGNDTIYGGDGADAAEGGNGSDSLFGGEGDDVLSGGNSSDKLDGAQGNDVLTGGNDSDQLQGGAGNDIEDGGNGADVIDGGPAADTIRGGDGEDLIFAGAGDDAVFGGRGSDDLHGGPGDDSVSGDHAADNCDGGTGANEFTSCENEIDAGGPDVEGDWADFDGDGAFDAIELRAGTDPLVADTDGDELSDGDELLSITDPTLADSDSNGIRDGADDPDNDGVQTSIELDNGSSAGDPDTDHDGVLDAEELADGTDSRLTDSDSDGLRDDQERTLGLDGSIVDSDDDGVSDGDEIFEREVPSESTPATFVARGVGSAVLAASVEVPDDDRLVDVPGQRAPPVEVLTPLALTSGTLSIPFDPAGIDSADEIAVLHFDDESGTFDRPADQVVDLGAGVVTVTTSDFSPFVVVKVSEFAAVWQTEITTPREGNSSATSIDVVLTLDSSGSMTGNDPSGARRTAAKAFVDALLAGDRAAVVDFDSSARLYQGLTDDFAAVKAAINRIDSSGGTNLSAGMNAALNELDANGEPDHQRIIVFLTDGVGSYSSSYTNRAIATDTIVYTVSLGSNTSTSLLNSIATATGGKFFQVANAGGLGGAFDRIGEDLGAPDADGDGLSDAAETEGWRNGSGQIFRTDPNDSDTDNDELTDGDEAGAFHSGGLYGAGSYYFTYSNPTKVDTDRDSLDDAYEVAEGLSAWKADLDYDGLNDAAETQVHSTEAFVNDTDVDGYLDKWETQHTAEGFDPLIYDPTVTPLDYAGEFARGALCGDILAPPFCEPAGAAFLIGSIASGIIAIGDIRDAIANVIKLDFVSAGLSIASLIPIAGDAVSIGKKTNAFIEVSSGLVGGHAFRNVMKDVGKSNADKIKQLKEVAPAAVSKLKSANIPDDVIVRLASKMISAKHFDDMVAAAKSIKRAPSPGVYSLEKHAEDMLRARTPDALPAQVLSKSADGSVKRFYDVLVRTSGWADEVKHGRARFVGRAANQLANDVKLLADPTSGVRKVTWHFFTNTTNTVGPDVQLLSKLKTSGIDFILWVP